MRANYLQFCLSIKSNPEFGTQKQREELAEEKYGKMNGPPIVCKFMKEHPEVLRIKVAIPIMHGKIDLCTYTLSPCLWWMSKTKTPGFRTLCRRMDNCRDSLEHGKLCTNATGLYELSKRFVDRQMMNF